MMKKTVKMHVDKKFRDRFKAEASLQGKSIIDYSKTVADVAETMDQAFKFKKKKKGKGGLTIDLGF